MAVHWKIPFRSLGGTSYEIRIYDDSYTSSTAVTLVGGATPLVTQEDDDDDVFTPVRTQTGYIRIFDDGKDANGNSFNWRDLIPVGALDRQVDVMSGSTLIWRGYIQPQSFSGDIYNGGQEREFPICDRLTILKCYDIVPSDYQNTNFARVLYYIFTKIPTPSALSFAFGGGSYVDGWLKKNVSWSLFGEEDSGGTVQPKYSCYEMLEEVCKFFGWTCRLYNGVVFFELSGDSSNWRQMAYSALGSLASGSSYSYSDSTSTTRTSLPGAFVSMNNSETFVPGWRKCRVESDVNKMSTVMEYPSQEVMDYFDFITPGRSGTRPPYWFIKKNPSNFYSVLSFKDVLLAFHQEGSGGTFARSNPDIYAYLEERVPHNIDFINSLAVWRSPATSPTYLFRMTSKRTFSLYDGIVVISAKAQIDERQESSSRVVTYDAYGILELMLKVGNKYWNGSTWTETLSTFLVQTGGADRPSQTEQQEGVGSIWNDHYFDSEYPDYVGHGIPVTGSVGGIVEFSIVGFTDLTYSSESDMRQVNLTDLKIEFLRKRSSDVKTDADTNRYVASGNRLFFHEKEVHTIFTCDSNNQFGLSIITNPDGSYCQTLTFADGDASAGQHLANRMASFGNKIRRVMQLEVEGGDAYTPKILLSYGGVTYATIGIGRDWRNDAYTMKFIEID
jgi:hypothetical protein